MPYYQTMIMWECVRARVTSHLVYISLGGPLFAEAFLLHNFGIVVLLGLLQSLRDALDVLDGLEGRRHLFFCLKTHILQSKSEHNRPLFMMRVCMYLINMPLAQYSNLQFMLYCIVAFLNCIKLKVFIQMDIKCL